MSNLENYKTELVAIKDAIDGIYKNEIYDNEYTFEESKYILKEPMIHLDVDKILEDLKNDCCEIKNINEDNLKFVCKNTYKTDHSGCNNCYYNYSNGHNNTCAYPQFRGSEIINLNFPIEFKLNDYEFIIKFYKINIDITENLCHNNYFKTQKSIIIVYITNYGRIIKSNDIKLIPSIFEYNPSSGYDNGGNHNTKMDYIKIVGNIIYINNKTNIDNNAANLCGYSHPGYGYGNHSCGYSEVMTINIGGNSNKINLIEQPKLLYRIPRLFIEVIDAFHTQNTDLMQECCKQYLEISRESKVKESIMKDIKIKEIKNEKDNIIKEKDNIIDDKNKEIDDLKIKLEMLQQKYDKIKSMFE